MWCGGWWCLSLFFFYTLAKDSKQLGWRLGIFLFLAALVGPKSGSQTSKKLQELFKNSRISFRIQGTRFWWRFLSHNSPSPSAFGSRQFGVSRVQESPPKPQETSRSCCEQPRVPRNSDFDTAIQELNEIICGLLPFLPLFFVQTTTGIKLAATLLLATQTDFVLVLLFFFFFFDFAGT